MPGTLAQEGVPADPLGHRLQHRDEIAVVEPLGVDQRGQQLRRDARKPAHAHHGDARAALARFLAAVRPGGGADQPHAGDPRGRLAPAREGDIAAHREATDGKPRGQVGKQPIGHRLDVVVGGEIGDLWHDHVGQPADLGLPQAGVAQQAGEQDQDSWCIEHALCCC